MMIRLLCLLLLTSTAFARELSGTYLPTNSPCPTPEEARQKMTVPEGYEVRCFAHEPMVQNPVAMTWDHRGRLWVVEAYEYPNGSDHPAPFGGAADHDKYQPLPKLGGKIPRDRVIILEDTDNNGEADKRTVFVEGLNLASAIICGDDGIYVGQQPHIIHFKDADHDDQPEQWRVVLTGFGREDTHELVNSFCWGPDGWLYMTHGVFTHSKVRRPGQPESEGFKFDAGIGRCRPLNREKEAPWEFEVFADGTSNPWGCDYDAAGNFFVSACVIDHFFHMAPGGIYVRQGGAPENPYSYEQLPSIVKHKHFRAAYAGVQIYQGGVYPKDTWGHAFIGNIHDNAIHEEVITPVGASFKCEPRRDFLRANDGWFRPVSTQTGPDGYLWIMDWCDKYPCYQNAKANPEGVDRDRGRIWRVVYKDVPSKDIDLKKLPTADLVKTLEHPNNWMRRMARRMLIEQRAEGTREALLQTAKSDAPVSLRLEAIWTLSAINSQDYRAIQWLAKNDPNPALKAWAARLFGEGGHVGHGWLDELAANPDPSVRLAVSIALRQKREVHLTSDRARPSLDSMGRSNGPTVLETNLLKAGVDADDKVLPLAIWMAIEPVLADRAKPWLDWLAGIAPKTQPLSRVLTHKAMRRLCDTRKAENLDLALDFLTEIKAHDVLLAQALEGLVKAQEGGIIKPTKRFSAFFAELSGSANAEVRKHARTLSTLWGDPAAIQRLAGQLLDGKTPEAERIAALQTLRKVRSDDAKRAYASILSGGLKGDTFALEVIRAASDLGDDSFPAAISNGWTKLSAPLQLAALDVLASRPAWTHAMLDAIAAEKISAGGFPASVRRQLATSQDKAIRDHAFKVLGAWKDSSDDIKALIAAKRKACLEGEPDLANGKLLFTTTCAVCHVFHGGGQKVGPDLIGSGRSNLDALLANVIDPNQIIGNGYENIIITTKDNRTLMGRITEDTPSHVKLLAIGGAGSTVARDQIAKLDNTKQSLMPMGFGGLPDAQFRDLIWYILSPPEEGPLTAEKKKLLSTSMDAAPADNKPKGTNWRAIDWESVSLWNPQWKVAAPEFERTPLKLADYHGRSNVLLMHPFEDKKTPASLEQKLVIDAAKPKLKFSVAADDRGDWLLKVVSGGKQIKELVVDHESPRWKDVLLDFSDQAGKELVIRLEAHPDDWAWEFSYWSNIRWE